MKTHCSLNGCAEVHTPASCPVYGSLLNRINKKQKAWNYWHAKRQLNPIMASNWEQQLAERFCQKIGPVLHDLKTQLNSMRI